MTPNAPVRITAPGRGWSDDLDRAGAFVPTLAQCHGVDVGQFGTLREGRGVSGGIPFFVQRVAPTINASGKAAGSATQQDAENGLLVAFGGNDCSGNARRVAAGLNARSTARQDFETETFIVNAVNNGQGSWRESEKASALGTAHRATYESTVCVTGQRTHALTHEGADASEDGTGRGTPTVAFSANDYTTGSYRAIDVSPPLTTNTDATRGTPLPVSGLSVRRLTPRECERLMGWPDDWTRYRANGKEIADGPRYRLCGNGVVRSVAAWVARRLAKEMSQVSIKRSA